MKHFKSTGHLKSFIKKSSGAVIDEMLGEIFRDGYRTALADIKSAQQEYAESSELPADPKEFDESLDAFLEDNQELMDKLAESETDKFGRTPEEAKLLSEGKLTKEGNPREERYEQDPIEDAQKEDT